MKILWFVNGILPAIAHNLNRKPTFSEGWLVGLSKALTTEYGDDLALYICCPQNIAVEVYKGKVDNYSYFAYPEMGDKTQFSPKLKDILLTILEEIQPDVVHIMGSEFPHCYSAISACKQVNILNRTVISIQGLTSLCARHYCLGLPSRVKKKGTLRDFLKKQSVSEDRKKYEQRGKYEIKAIEMCKHVIGRTEWDYACIKQINPQIKYYFNNETLRPAFYINKWSYDRCHKHTIFFSQATNPIKGFHFMLDALRIIKKKYPNVKLYCAGSETMLSKVAYPNWRRRTYEKYLFKLMQEYGLIDNIVLCGSLDETEMRDQYLNANVFVSASTIENSPNSVGEAMLLGVPVVSSDVGGVSSLMVHGKEGYLYPADEPYMLAHYVCKIFENSELACELSNNARIRAQETHSPQKNSKELIEIYSILAKKLL
jgi:glycosyltransferase involved in cell wall biosynthesis